MKEYQGLAYMRWDCKYHVVFIPRIHKEENIRSIAPAKSRSIEWMK